MPRLALALLATVLAAAEAGACSCVRLSRADVIGESAVAFSGTVRNVIRQGDQLAMTVRVADRIKGRVPDEVTVLTRRDGARCGYPMQAGQSRDFAGTPDERGRISVSSCTMMPLNPAR